MAMSKMSSSSPTHNAFLTNVRDFPPYSRTQDVEGTRCIVKSTYYKYLQSYLQRKPT